MVSSMKKYILILLILLIPEILFAQSQYNFETQFTFDYFQDVKNKIYENSAYWMATIKKVALNLFYILAGISFIAKFIMDIMSKGEIDTRESITFIVKFIITTGFFYYLLDNGSDLAKSIVTSFEELGKDAVSGQLSFTNLLDIGFKMLGSGDAIGWGDWEIKIVHFVLSVLTLVFLVIMYANLIIEEIAAAIMIYAGFFVLALGGMDYTRDSAINYFKAILGISLKILTIMLLLSITIGILNDLVKDLNLGSDNKQADAMIIYNILVSFLTVFFLALLSMKVPDAVSNLVSSAWGNMSGLTLMGGIALATNIAQKTANAVHSAFKGGKNAVAGYKDYQKNKEISEKKKEAESRGEDTSLNPMFNKQKSGSGGAYYGGKAAAAVSDKLGGIFGNKSEMSDTNIDNDNTSNTTVNNNNTENTTSTPQKDNNPESSSSSEKPADIQKNNENITNSEKSHLDNGGRDV